MRGFAIAAMTTAVVVLVGCSDAAPKEAAIPRTTAAPFAAPVPVAATSSIQLTAPGG
ncbi:MAG: hypothetical protein QOI61_2082, partial [Actinomycetota bacterium]